MSSNATSVDRKKAIALLWRRGTLSWMLDETQKQLLDIYANTPDKINTWLLPRRFGKTHSLCVLALQQCIKHPMSIVKFLSPTMKQVDRNLRPLLRELLLTCPDDIKPQFKAKDNVYYFKNGSEIQLAGSEGGNIESLRGGSSHMCIIDEAQNVEELVTAVRSVLLPTTSTTGGKIILAGTPPEDPDHAFLDYVSEAETKGRLVRRTVYDNPRILPSELEEIIKASGGVNSEHFQREFMCKTVKSSTMSVVPEFDEDKAKLLVREWEKPDFYHPYVSMDLGLRDMTVCLFAYYDFLANKVVIEDEIVMQGNSMHLYKLAQDIIHKEEELWTNKLTNEVIKVRKRVADHDLIAINEIHKASGYKIYFNLADKKIG